MWEVILTNAKAYLPKAADTVLRTVGIKLLGKLIEIPEAWADQKIQRIRTATDAEISFNKTVVDAAAKRVAANPAVIDAVATDMLETHWKKINNKKSVFAKTLQSIGRDSQASDGNFQEPDEDWLNSFSRFAEDATSDRLQDLLSKILAGEIRKRGSYSVSTLRIVSELDQATATIFQRVYEEAIGDVIFRDDKYRRSPHWSDIVLLRDAGFVSAPDAAVHQPTSASILTSGNILWNFGPSEYSITIEVTPPTVSEIPIFNLTKMGREIGSLLPEPDTEKNLRSMVSKLASQKNWQRVTLLRSGAPAETLFDTGQNTWDMKDHSKLKNFSKPS